MKYIIETEFIGHEYEIVVEDDTPVQGMSRDIVKKHIKYGPYKTKRGAENALRTRKEYWCKKGFKRPPKGASLYDPHGNYMFKPSWSNMSKKAHNKRMKESCFTQPDNITFRIEERVVSKEKAKRTENHITHKAI